MQHERHARCLGQLPLDISVFICAIAICYRYFFYDDMLQLQFVMAHGLRHVRGE